MLQQKDIGKMRLSAQSYRNKARKLEEDDQISLSVSSLSPVSQISDTSLPWKMVCLIKFTLHGREDDIWNLNVFLFLKNICFAHFTRYIPVIRIIFVCTVLNYSTAGWLYFKVNNIFVHELVTTYVCTILHSP